MPKGKLKGRENLQKRTPGSGTWAAASLRLLLLKEKGEIEKRVNKGENERGSAEAVV